jgi:hypothetical protein
MKFCPDFIDYSVIVYKVASSLLSFRGLSDKNEVFKFLFFTTINSTVSFSYFTYLGSNCTGLIFGKTSGGGI